MPSLINSIEMLDMDIYYNHNLCVRNHWLFTFSSTDDKPMDMS